MAFPRPQPFMGRRSSHLEGAAATGLAFLPGPAMSCPDEALARTLAAWMRQHEQRSLRTALAYQREVRAFLVFLHQQHDPGLGCLLSAQPSECSAFIQVVPGLAASSRALKAAILRGMFGALVEEGLRSTNPAADIRIRNVASGKHHRAMSQADVVGVLCRLKDGDSLRDIRDRALLLLVLAVGARRFEVATFNVGSIQREGDSRAFIEFTGKGKKHVRMSILASVVRAIDHWLEMAGHGGKPEVALFHSLSHRPEHAGRRLTGGHPPHHQVPFSQTLDSWPAGSWYHRRLAAERGKSRTRSGVCPS